MTPENIVALIPTFQEAPVIGSVVAAVRPHVTHVVVIDDGSLDATADEARQAGALVVRHDINRGKGAATITGLAVAKRLQADIVVTLDGDGQHDAADIPRILEPIKRGVAEVVLGVRPFRSQAVPPHKRALNRVGNAITWAIHGLHVADSQSGFRAYSRKAIDLFKLNAERYELDSEIIREIRRHNLPFTECPITVHYTDYARQKPHRQTLVNGAKTVYRMMWDVIS